MLENLLSRIESRYSSSDTLSPSSASTSAPSSPEKSDDIPMKIQTASHEMPSIVGSKRKADEYEPGQLESENIFKNQRMQRNRESAARSRHKKREHLNQLEDQITVLSDHVKNTQSLQDQITLLQQENWALKERLKRYEDSQQSPAISSSSPTSPYDREVNFISFDHEGFIPPQSQSQPTQSSSTSLVISHNNNNIEPPIANVEPSMNICYGQKTESVPGNHASYINKYAKLDGIFSLQLEGAWIFWQILFGVAMFLRLLISSPKSQKQHQTTGLKQSWILSSSPTTTMGKLDQLGWISAQHRSMVFIQFLMMIRVFSRSCEARKKFLPP